MKVKNTRGSESAAAAEHATHNVSITSTDDGAPTPTPPKAVQTPKKSTKSRQTRDIRRIKAKLAAPQVFYITACVAHIALVFVILSFRLQQISIYLKPGLENARIELRAQKSLVYREHMLYT